MEVNNIIDLILGLYSISCLLGLGCFLAYRLFKSAKKEDELKERLVKAIEKVSDKYDK